MSVAATYFRHRSALLVVLAWPVAASALSAPPPSETPVAVGVALVALGALLRLSAARAIGRGARVHRAKVRGALVTWGPYRWTRNPLYLAAALVLAGLALVAGAGWWGLLLAPATLLLYTPVVLHEERSIASSAGSGYAAYQGAVPRWLGIPRALPEELLGPREPLTPWGEVLRRETRLLPWLSVAIGGLLAARAGLLPAREVVAGLASLVGLDPGLLLALGFLLAVAINSWLLEKKHRRLDARRARTAAEREGGGASPLPAEEAREVEERQDAPLV